MPNTLLFTWVKNVYSLGMGRRTTSAQPSTEVSITNANTNTPVYKSPVFRLVFPGNTSLFSTQFLLKFHLLMRWLYTQSTGPIMRTNKEKRERITIWN